MCRVNYIFFSLLVYLFMPITPGSTNCKCKTLLNYSNQHVKLICYGRYVCKEIYKYSDE